MDIVFAIPSYKRAERQPTLDYLERLGFPKDSIVISTQTQEDYEQYRARYAGRATVIYRAGENMSDNLNNLLAHVPDGMRVVIMDDDIRSLKRIVSKKELRAIETRNDWDQFLEEGYSAAEGFGSIGFSVYPVCNAYFMSETITRAALGEGTLLGLTKVNGLKFDRNLPVKMDYDLSCRIIRRYGAYPRLNMYACDAPHYTKGGCEEWWANDQLNQKIARTLAHRYPDMIAVRKNKSGEVRLLK